jgi:hypothetical protein
MLPRRAPACTVGLLILCQLLLHGGVYAQTLEQHAIEAIRRDAVAVSGSETGTHPLPLAASWNTGTAPTGFSPDYQVEQIRLGGYLLPWFRLTVPYPAPGLPDNYPAAADAAYYYRSAVDYLAQHHLPLSFESTQWEALLPQVSADYANKGRDGTLSSLSPFDALAPWYEVGHRWARQPTLRQLQKLYPDPPLVLFLSNNEQPKLSPRELHADCGPAADASMLTRCRAIGDAWIERYRALQRGFREGLESPAWRARAVFVGFDAFVGSAMGRWSGWTEWSLYVPGRTEPWPYAWDGASVEYYLHDWAPDSDFAVWSPQVEAMNHVAVLAEVRRANPAFWFELSVWDGQEPGLPTDKLQFFRSRGQQYTPARYGGLVQFGMWLLRPRVVREFRNPEHDRIRFGPYFDVILAAVARVHDDATLNEFWRSGRLLENPVGGHPYQVALPGEIAGRERWFLLDARLNPPRPWQLTTPLRIFALALERGTSPHRQWLIYAFSPLDAAVDSELSIPNGPRVQVQATSAGAFAVVDEGNNAARPVGS